MKRLLIVFALVAGTILAQGPPRRSFAGPGPGPMGFGAGGPGFSGALLDRLDSATFDALKTYLTLTDAQVTSLKAAAKARAEANKPVIEQIQAKQKALREEMAKDDPSGSVVGGLIVDIKKLRESLRDKATGPSTDALAVLTPAQQAKLKELEAAQKLVSSVHQAEALGLLARPEPPAGAARAAGGARTRQLMRANGVRRVGRAQI